MPTTILPVDWREVRHVILDFGGVLYQIDHARTAAAFDALGLRDFAREYAHQGQSRLVSDLERGQISETQFLGSLQLRCRQGTTLAQVQDAWNAVLIGPRPDILPVLKSLAGSHDLLLFSNTNSIHAAHFEQQILGTLGTTFHESFRQVVYSHRLGERKPNPEAFEQVTQQCGLDPESVLFIDDTRDNITAARRAGWNAVYHNPEDHTFQELFRRLDYPI